MEMMKHDHLLVLSILLNDKTKGQLLNKKRFLLCQFKVKYSKKICFLLVYKCKCVDEGHRLFSCRVNTNGKLSKMKTKEWRKYLISLSQLTQKFLFIITLCTS